MSQIIGISKIDWEKVSSNKEIEAEERLLIDCSSGPITLTLPASPNDGDIVSFMHIDGDITSNTITISRNGNKIENISEDLIIDIENFKVELVYRESDLSWYFVY